MTERVYYTDAYCARFEARVLEKTDGRRIYLDRTAFYPTSGGQPHDRGTLGRATVVDVIDEGDRIAHVIEGEIDAEHVTGEVDWQRRYDHMQQHTGQHVLSALFAESLGAETVSVHFGAQASTLDLDVQNLSADQLAAVERRANEVAWENRLVEVAFEDALTAKGLRKPSDRAGDLRIVSIQGIDRSACGGTHVRGTSETAPVLLRRTEKAKKALRIEFLCGGRALNRVRADYALLTRMAQSASTSLDELGAVFEAQSAALRESELARRKLAETLDQYRARELYAAARVDALGIRRVLERSRGSLEEVRGLALAYAALPRAVFVATADSPPALLVAASDDAGVNAGEALRAAVTALGGRGGGSPRLAQGTLPSVDALAAAVRLLSPDALP
ncbi:MAG TPA: DHHA1 domain-containing protein [Gemmatimonadaceae bacterium]|nr:DHHA1 domain-containing protein [Gemmatimonadaceae bacterium]